MSVALNCAAAAEVCCWVRKDVPRTPIGPKVVAEPDAAAIWCAPVTCGAELADSISAIPVRRLRRASGRYPKVNGPWGQRGIERQVPTSANANCRPGADKSLLRKRTLRAQDCRYRVTDSPPMARPYIGILRCRHFLAAAGIADLE